MRLALDFESGHPLYVQIGRHFRDAILSDNLGPGVRLPAVRTLAASLGVNRATVESAYAELMAQGLVISRQGSGFYVLAHAPGEPIAAPPRHMQTTSPAVGHRPAVPGLY